MRSLLQNVKTEVEDCLGQFQQEVEGLLEQAISSIASTLGRLETQLDKALDGDPEERQGQLVARQKALQELESEFALIAGPEW
jgi:hypothetical protein